MTPGAPTPLAEVERTVQARAAAGQLDVTRRRVRSYATSSTRRSKSGATTTGGAARPRPCRTRGLAERALRNLARYGPLTELLDDDDVWEIMVNSPVVIFVRRHGRLADCTPRCSTTTST